MHQVHVGILAAHEKEVEACNRWGGHTGAFSGHYHGVKLGSGCSSMHTWPWSTPELRTIVQCQPYQSEGTPLLVDREEDFYPGLVSLRVVMQK